MENFKLDKNQSNVVDYMLSLLCIIIFYSKADITPTDFFEDD